MVGEIVYPRRFLVLMAVAVGISLSAGTALAHQNHDSVPDTPAGVTVPTGVEDRPLPDDIDLETVGNYGGDVALSEDGRLLAVGADQTDVGGAWNAGSVHVFERSGDGNWALLVSLTAPSPQNDGGFGDAVAFGPDTLAVGAPFTAGSGLVYIYPIAELTSEDPQPQVVEPNEEGEAGRFGNMLSLSGDRLAVGDNTPRVVSLYERVDGAWMWQTTFGSNASRPSASFGADDTVALDGDVLVAGDVGYSNRSLPGDAGAVFVYQHDNDSGKWQHAQTLTSPDPKRDGLFGRADLDGDTLAVGAAGRFTVHGRLHVFEATGADRSDWAWEATFHPEDNEGNLGRTVAVHDGSILAGAPNEDAKMRGVLYDGFTDIRETGAVYWFHEDEGGHWEQTTMLRAPVPNAATTSANNFGRSLALSSSYAVAGGLSSVEHPERYDPSLVGEEPEWTVPGRVTVFGPDRDIDHLADARKEAEGTPVDDLDADDDGLTDGIEVVRWLSDPHDADTDDDGLTDGFEAWESKTQTRDADTDGDGFSDALEVRGVEANGQQVIGPSNPNDHREMPLVPVSSVSPYYEDLNDKPHHRRDLLPTPPADQPRHWPGFLGETIDEEEDFEEFP